MLDQTAAAFDLRIDHDLNLMRDRQTLDGLTARILTVATPVLELAAPDAVLVHGDTTTALALALASFYRQIPVGHVEAGLRSGNRYSPFPEEMNRRLISSLSTWHYAPTEGGARTWANRWSACSLQYATRQTPTLTCAWCTPCTRTPPCAR